MAVFQIFQHNNQKKIETPKNKENAFSKTVLYIFCKFKTTWSLSIFKNFVKITGPYCWAYYWSLKKVFDHFVRFFDLICSDPWSPEVQ
jgi:hypothetical protein